MSIEGTKRLSQEDWQKLLDEGRIHRKALFVPRASGYEIETRWHCSMSNCNWSCSIKTRKAAAEDLFKRHKNDCHPGRGYMLSPRQ